MGVDEDPSLWFLAFASRCGHSRRVRVRGSGACEPGLQASAWPRGLGGAQQGRASREHHLLGRAEGRAHVRPVHVWPFGHVLRNRLPLALHVNKASGLDICPALYRRPKVDEHRLDRLRRLRRPAVGRSDPLPVCAMSGSAHFRCRPWVKRSRSRAAQRSTMSFASATRTSSGSASAPRRAGSASTSRVETSSAGLTARRAPSAARCIRTSATRSASRPRTSSSRPSSGCCASTTTRSFDGDVVWHGDFGPWNIVWRDARPFAVIDFDNVYRGDPAATSPTPANVRRLRLRRRGAGRARAADARGASCLRGELRRRRHPRARERPRRGALPPERLGRQLARLPVERAWLEATERCSRTRDHSKR